MTSVFAITGYEIALWIHISAAVVGLGATFAEAVFFPVAMSMDARYLPLVHQLQLTINRYLANPALLLVLVTGIYQVADGDWEFGSFWISATFAIVIVLGGLLGGFFIPTDKKLLPMVQAEIAAAGDGPVALSAEYQQRAKAEGIAGAVAGVLVIVAIFLMVVKPGA
jgi:uncharacterized membrane protein